MHLNKGKQHNLFRKEKMAPRIDLKTITDLSVLFGTAISVYYLVNRLLAEAEGGPLSGNSKD